MFHFKELEIRLHPKVYDPAEDSFFLLEALDVNPGDRVLEIGTGCGLIALACAYQGSDVICTDCNPYAVALTKENYLKNHHLLSGSIIVREGDMFSPIKKGEIFEGIVFNPPYLPTSQEDKVDLWCNQATDGGKDGIEVTKRFVKDVCKYLSVKGREYFIFSSLSNRLNLESFMKKQLVHYTIVKHRQFHDETIDIYRIHH